MNRNVNLNVTAKNHTKAAFKGVDRSLRSVSRAARGLRGSMLWGAGGVAVLALGLNKLASAFTQSAAEIERTKALLTGLEKSSVKAGKSLDWLLDFAIKAPFELDSLTDTFVKLKTSGLDPTRGAMQALTDAVAAYGGTSEDLRLSSIAIMQMSSKGVISMEEMRRQLGERIPSALKIMARELGLTYSELVEKISSGGLLATEGIPALIRGFERDFKGAAGRLMKTWNGLLSQMQTRFMKFQNLMMTKGPFQSMKLLLQEGIKAWDELGEKGQTEIAFKLSDMAMQALRAVVVFVEKLVRVGPSIIMAMKGVGLLLVGLAGEIAKLTVAIYELSGGVKNLLLLGGLGWGGKQAFRYRKGLQKAGKKVLAPIGPYDRSGVAPKVNLPGGSKAWPMGMPPMKLLPAPVPTGSSAGKLAGAAASGVGLLRGNIATALATVATGFLIGEAKKTGDYNREIAKASSIKSTMGGSGVVGEYKEPDFELVDGQFASDYDADTLGQTVVGEVKELSKTQQLIKDGARLLAGSAEKFDALAATPVHDMATKLIAQLDKFQARAKYQATEEGKTVTAFIDKWTQAMETGAMEEGPPLAQVVKGAVQRAAFDAKDEQIKKSGTFEEYSQLAEEERLLVRDLNQMQLRTIFGQRMRGGERVPRIEVFQEFKEKLKQFKEQNPLDLIGSEMLADAEERLFSAQASSIEKAQMTMAEARSFWGQTYEEQLADAATWSDEQLSLKEDLTRSIKEMTLDEVAFKKWQINEEYDAYAKLAEGKKELELMVQEARLLALAEIKDKQDEQLKELKGSLEQTFSTAFNNILDRTKSFKETMLDMLRSIANKMINMLIFDPLSKKLAKVLLGGGGGGSAIGAGFGADAIFASTLGMGSMFHNGGVVPRLHNGLKPDEFPAILQAGEQVIPKHEIGNQPGSTVNININAVDAQSFNEMTSRNPSAIVAPIVKALQGGDRGLRSTLQGALA